MPVTELALLHLKSPAALSSEAAKSGLLEAKNAMQRFTGYPFYFYEQVEDPTYIYIIGSWDSLKQHFEEWIPSSANQDLLEKLKDVVEVEWMFHLDIDQLDPKSAIPIDAPTLSITRHFISPEKKDNFAQTFAEVKHLVAEFTAPNPISGGWRLDQVHDSETRRAVEEEEFVLFTGFKDIPHHHEFAQTNEFKDYARIREFLESFEVKHATRLQL